MMKETDEQMRERLTNVLNKYLGWRTRLRWFFHPKRKKLAIDLLVNQAKYMDCHKDEIKTVKLPEDVLSNVAKQIFPTRIENSYYNPEQCKPCSCPYPKQSIQSLDFHSLIYCKKCGKVIVYGYPNNK